MEKGIIRKGKKRKKSLRAWWILVAILILPVRGACAQADPLKEGIFGQHHFSCLMKVPSTGIEADPYGGFFTYDYLRGDGDLVGKEDAIPDARMETKASERTPTPVKQKTTRSSHVESTNTDEGNTASIQKDSLDIPISIFAILILVIIISIAIFAWHKAAEERSIR